VGVITRIALCLAALALMAPAWLYTVQASLSPELRLIDTLPPMSSLFAVFMAMLMIFVPGRRAYVAAAVGWVLVASPVLVYLLTHREELWTPRGVDLAMAFGPAAGLEVVDALAGEPTLKSYHLLPSVRGDLLAKLGRHEEAQAEFVRAAALTRNTRERGLLLRRAQDSAGAG